MLKEIRYWVNPSWMKMAKQFLASRDTRCICGMGYWYLPFPGRLMYLSTSSLKMGRLNPGNLEMGRLEMGHLNLGNLEMGRLEMGHLNLGSMKVGRLNPINLNRPPLLRLPMSK